MDSKSNHASARCDMGHHFDEDSLRICSRCPSLGMVDASPLGADLSLGIFLLVLIGFNILIAQRHDDDAIAAQATLVLLALGSATGALYDELGVAGMILLGTLSMHGLALHRKSGNLASLGIAVSYLWIGLHAFSNDWTIVSIQIVSFDDDLLLFMLMFAVTATNAVMATQFHKADNWFSAVRKPSVSANQACGPFPLAWE